MKSILLKFSVWLQDRYSKHGVVHGTMLVISIWQDGSFSYARMKPWIDTWTSFLSTFCVNPLANWLWSNSIHPWFNNMTIISSWWIPFQLQRQKWIGIYLSRCKWKWASSPCSKWTICLPFAQEWESLCIVLGPSSLVAQQPVKCAGLLFCNAAMRCFQEVCGTSSDLMKSLKVHRWGHFCVWLHPGEHHHSFSQQQSIVQML